MTGDRHHQRPFGELELLLRRRDTDRRPTIREVADHHDRRDERSATSAAREAVQERTDGDGEPQALEEDLGIGQAQEQGDGEHAAREVDQASQQDRIEVRETR